MTEQSNHSKDSAAQSRYIVVEGPIGVGKTSLARLLAERLKARTFYEQVEQNPFLEAFYKNPEKYAFQTQIFFLLFRFQQQKELAQQDLFKQTTISDYLFAKDRVFAYLNLTEQELWLYEQLYKQLDPKIVKPDLVVYLTADAKILMRRIKQRGFIYERRITQAYLEEVVRSYSKFFFSYDQSPLLVVNTNDFDFVHSTDDFESLVKEIENTRHGVKHFIPLNA